MDLKQFHPDSLGEYPSVSHAGSNAYATPPPTESVTQSLLREEHVSATESTWPTLAWLLLLLLVALGALAVGFAGKAAFSPAGPTCILSQESGNGNSPCSCDTMRALLASTNSTTQQLFLNLTTTQNTGFASVLSAVSSLSTQLSTCCTNILNALGALATQISDGFTTVINLLNALIVLANQLAAQQTNTQNLINITRASILASIPCPDQPLVPQFYARQAEVVLTDPLRQRNGLYTNGTNVGGPRHLNIIVNRPAFLPGTGSPLFFSEVRPLHGGAFSGAGYSSFSSTRGTQLKRTYTDAVAMTEPRPLIWVGGGGANTNLAIKQAEALTTNYGYITILVSAVGVDGNACPPAVATCGTAGAGIFGFNDLRSVLDLLLANAIPILPLSAIKTDVNGTVMMGCSGGSASANSCLQMAAGLGLAGNAANGFPLSRGLYGPHPSAPIKAVFAGDTHLDRLNNFLNFTEFRASLALFNDGFSLNWLRSFFRYSNAKQRIFYRLWSARHMMSDLSGSMICDQIRECGRVFFQGVSTPFDVAACARAVNVTGLVAQFAHCSQEDIEHIDLIPGTVFDAPRAAVALELKQFVPTSGISVSANSAWESALLTYPSLFFKAIFDDDVVAAKAAVSNNLLPDHIEGIYVNKIPAVTERPFNLQNKTIQYVLSPDGTHYLVNVTNRTDGAIPDPSSAPGAFSLFGNSALSRNTGPPLSIALAMGSFPLPTNGNAMRNSTSYMHINSGIIMLDGVGFGTIDTTYYSPRIDQWTAQNGFATYQYLGTNMANNGAVNASSSNKVWIQNTASFLRVTAYRVGWFGTPTAGNFNTQVTFYANGTIIHEFDGTIPTNLLKLEPRYPTAAVGYSTGRLYLDPNQGGKFNPAAHPNVRTFSEIQAGMSSANSASVAEFFNAPENADWAANSFPFLSVS